MGDGWLLFALGGVGGCLHCTRNRKDREEQLESLNDSSCSVAERLKDYQSSKKLTRWLFLSSTGSSLEIAPWALYSFCSSDRIVLLR